MALGGSMFLAGTSRRPGPQPSQTRACRFYYAAFIAVAINKQHYREELSQQESFWSHRFLPFVWQILVIEASNRGLRG